MQSWPHGSGKRVLPWPGSAGRCHQPGVLERVTNGPSVLGQPGEVLAAGSAKTLCAEMIPRIAGMPGCALQRARLICFQSSPQMNGRFGPPRPVPQFPTHRVKAPSRLPALHTGMLFGKHRALQPLSLWSRPAGALNSCISLAPGCLGRTGRGVRACACVCVHVRCRQTRCLHLWETSLATPFPKVRAGGVGRGGRLHPAAVLAEPQRKRLSCEAPRPRQRAAPAAQTATRSLQGPSRLS